MSPFESINSSPEPKKGETGQNNIQDLLLNLPKGEREEVMKRMADSKEEVRDDTRARLLQLKSQLDKGIDTVFSIMEGSPIKINSSVKQVKGPEGGEEGKENSFIAQGENGNEQDEGTEYASLGNNPNEQDEGTEYASLDGETKSMGNNPNEQQDEGTEYANNLSDDDAEYAKMMQDPNFENGEGNGQFYSIRNATPEELAKEEANKQAENTPEENPDMGNSSMASNESSIPVNAKINTNEKGKKAPQKPENKKVAEKQEQRTSRNPQGQEDFKPINSKVKSPKKEPTEAVKPADSQENIKIPELAKINLQDELKRINDGIKELNGGLAKIAFSKENRENAIKNVEDGKTIIKAMATMQEEVERGIREGRKPKELVAIINAHNEIINDYRRLGESIKAKGNKEAVAYLAKNDYKTMATDFSTKILNIDSRLKSQGIEFGSSKDYIRSLASTLTAGEDPKFISEKISSIGKRA